MSSITRKIYLLPFAVAIFTGAFLVFQVQPVIARFILPQYGGSPGVWTICLLFFQLGLLAGYSYSHFLARHLRLQYQAVVHICLLVISLLWLPITPELREYTQISSQSIEILILLSASVGVPFILLSASSPLFQHWFANVHPGMSPFRLYALSNFGSLLALLSYPFLIEPALTLSKQTLSWSIIYIVFIGMTLWCAWPLLSPLLHHILKPEAGEIKTQTKQINLSASQKVPSWIDRTRWLLLSACGSVVLLAVTNQMCQDVATFPFLWILPLSLYLITFIICFERDVWYQRKIWLPFLMISVGLLVHLLDRDYSGSELSLSYQIMIYCAALFGCCMVCHGEIVRKRPSAGSLTMFYLYVALGGALGGIFVNLIAPLIFDGFWELHGSVTIVCILAILFIALDQNGKDILPRNIILTSGSVGIGVLMWFLGQHILEQRETSIFNTRGFFGVIHVYEDDKGTREHFRTLYHGRIRHGEQWLHELEQHIPTSYYGPNSGIGLALNYYSSRNSENAGDNATRVGAIGLGVGTVAAYGKPGDIFRFYEINADIEFVARNYFTYLDNSTAVIEVIMGDARQSMQRELETSGSQLYDIIIVDAFSGDAIPIHLLTGEASDLYWQHLHENGILAMHITNLHVDLSDVVRQMAIHSNKEALYIEDYKEEYTDNSDWVLITSNQDFINSRDIQENLTDWPHELKSNIWTDDYSNLFKVVKW